MSYDLVTIARYDSSIQAHIVKAHLEGNGFVCFVFDDNVVDMYGLYSNAIGGVKIKVREKDAEEAYALVQELDKSPYTDQNDEVIACPNCGSTDYYKDFNSMRSLGSVLAAVAAFFIAVFPIYRKRVFRCKNCDTEFNPHRSNPEVIDQK